MNNYNNVAIKREINEIDRRQYLHVKPALYHMDDDLIFITLISKKTSLIFIDDAQSLPQIFTSSLNNE